MPDVADHVDHERLLGRRDGRRGARSSSRSAGTRRGPRAPSPRSGRGSSRPRPAAASRRRRSSSRRRTAGSRGRAPCTRSSRGGSATRRPVITSIISTESGSIWRARSILRLAGLDPGPEAGDLQAVAGVVRRITAKITTLSTKPTAGRPTPSARVMRRSGSVGHSDSTIVPSSGRPRTTHARRRSAAGRPSP